DDLVTGVQTCALPISGRLSRRQLMQRGAALGLSASFLNLLARQPEAIFAQQATPVASPVASPVAGGVGPAVDTVTFGAYNVDQEIGRASCRERVRTRV